MTFHKFIPNRLRAISYLTQLLPTQPAAAERLNTIKQYTSLEFVNDEAGIAKYNSATARNTEERHYWSTQFTLLVMEEMWHRSERPFYNIWPILYEIAPKIDIGIPWSQLKLPVPTLLLQYPEGNEFFGSCTTMLSIYDRSSLTAEQLTDNRAFNDDEMFIAIESRGKQSEESRVWMKCIKDKSQLVGDFFTGSDCSEDLLNEIKLVALISLVASGDDLITPALLAKDRSAIPRLTDDALAEWMMRKAEIARRRGVYGFDVGRLLQESRGRNPSFVLPYWAIRWTGKGGAIPRYTKVKGHSKGVVDPTSVPTGYLGKETEEELAQTLEQATGTQAVYFLKDGERPYVKIGHTDRPLRKRLRELYTANRRLVLLGFISSGNARQLEQEIHLSLRSTVRDGEFFYVSNEQCRSIVISHGGQWLADA
jgi:hypothetical protein